MIDQLIELLTESFEPVFENGPGVKSYTTKQLLIVFQDIIDVDKESMNNALESAGFELTLVQDDGEITGYRWLMKPIASKVSAQQ